MLSAVADRLGFWGTNSVWGNWTNFDLYNQELTFYFPQNLRHIAAYIATFLEIGFSILLIVGYKTKYTANGTGFLMLLFAISMSLAMGSKAPLDYSVWVSSAASFLLAEQTSFKWSIDSLLKK